MNDTPTSRDHGNILPKWQLHTYRKDIDGLRAVAVLSVILFHISKNILPGGYLGVDIFFVISGFLITQIVLRESRQQNFSIVKFYERRLRRIAPALFVVMAISSILAVLILLPLDLVGFGKSLFSALIFSSNIYFWRDTDYFAQAAELKPLLHTWSLGVEEQFYIFFPLLLVAIARRPLKVTFFCILVLSLLSLALNVVAPRVGAATPAFYLIPTRAWELGAGALIAAWPTQNWHRRLMEFYSVIGALLIVFALTFAPYILPAWIPDAVPAVIGSALLIFSGRSFKTPVARLLGITPLVAIGLISYSLYLWHWPVLVFGRYFAIEELEFLPMSAALVIMFGGAYLSWRYVERPFRNASVSARKIFVLSGMGAILFSGVFLSIILTGGFPSRLSPEASKINAAVGTHYRCAVQDYLKFGAGRACRMELESGNTNDSDVLLVGNSHAQMYAPLVADFLKRRGLNGLLVPANSCLPMEEPNTSLDCVKLSKANLVAAASHVRAKVVILAFLWEPSEKLVDRNGNQWHSQDASAIIEGLDNTVRLFRDAGKQVVIIGPIAIPHYDIASTLGRSIAFGREYHQPLNRPLDLFLEKFSGVLRHYGENPRVHFVRPDLIQCKSGSCDFVMDGKSLFADSNHLTRDALGIFQVPIEQGISAALP